MELLQSAQCSVQFVNETDQIVASTSGWDGAHDSADSDDGTDAAITEPSDGSKGTSTAGQKPKPGKKTRGRVKIEMKYIKNKIRRYTTFSKRKTGIMKKAYELSVLTGTQVMLLVASETGHVYTFATRKLHPMITSENGKALIQTCLCSPDTSLLGSSAESTGTGEPKLAPASLSAHLPTAAGNSKSDARDADGMMSASVSLALQCSPSPGLATSPATDDGHLQRNQLRANDAMTTEFNESRSLSKIVSGHFVSSGLSSCTATMLLPASLAGLESVAVDLRQQGATTTGMIIAGHSGSGANSFAQIDASAIQQQMAVKPQQQQQQCLFYQLPGTNQFVPVQVDSSSLPVGGQMTESLTDQSPSITVVNVGGVGGDDTLPGINTNGLMFTMSSANSTGSIPAEGFILNIPGTPAFAIPSELTSGQAVAKATDQFFTIPLSSHSQLLQPIFATSQSGPVGFFSGSQPATVGSQCLSRTGSSTVSLRSKKDSGASAS